MLPSPVIKGGSFNRPPFFFTLRYSILNSIKLPFKRPHFEGAFFFARKGRLKARRANFDAFGYMTLPGRKARQKRSGGLLRLFVLFRLWPVLVISGLNPKNEICNLCIVPSFGSEPQDQPGTLRHVHRSHLLLPGRLILRYSQEHIPSKLY